jgi:hypothetical protein
MGFALTLLLSSAVIAAPCTPAQRTDLTKLGYGPADVKELCGNASEIFKRAYTAKEAGNLQLSQQLFEQGLKVEPGNTLGQKLLAEVKEARATAQKFFAKGFDAKEAGDLQTAQQSFEEGLRIEPGNEMAQKLLAEVKTAQSKAQDGKAQALFEKGYDAKEAGDLQTAQSLFEEGLRLDPGNTMAQQFLAEIKEAAQRPPLKDGVAGTIQRQLELRYRLTKLTPDGTDVVAPGVVVELRKGPVVLDKVVPPVPNEKLHMVTNVYQNGVMTQDRLRGLVSALTAVVSTPGTEGPSRYFKQGEKVMVTRIAVQNDSVSFQLMTNPINANNDRYRGTLRVRNATNDPLTPDQAAKLIAEVFKPE